MYHVLRYLSTELSKTFFFLLKNHFTASDCHKITSAMFPNNNLCFYPVSKVYPSLHFIVLKVIYLYLKVTLKPKFTSDHCFLTACVSSLLEMRKVHPLPPFASYTFQDVGDEMSISGNQTSVMSQRTLKLPWYVSQVSVTPPDWCYVFSRELTTSTGRRQQTEG